MARSASRIKIASSSVMVMVRGSRSVSRSRANPYVASRNSTCTKSLANSSSMARTLHVGDDSGTVPHRPFPWVRHGRHYLGACPLPATVARGHTPSGTAARGRPCGTPPAVLVACAVGHAPGFGAVTRDDAMFPCVTRWNQHVTLGNIPVAWSP